MSSKCVICDKPLTSGKVSKVGKKGLVGLKAASEKRSDGLANKFSGAAGIEVHLDCRISYSRPNSIARAAEKNLSLTESHHREEPAPTLRSSVGPFSINRDCLFCGKEASVRKETKRAVRYRRTVHEVTTIPFKQHIQQHADRRADEWGVTVRARVDSVVDLIAAEAKHHKQCYLVFVSGNKLDSDGRGGRRTDDRRREAFTLLYEYMEESEDCQFSLADIEDYLEMSFKKLGCEPYTRKYIKEKLISHYGNRISITELPGKTAVINFKEAADNIIYEKWYEERKTLEAEERRRIVQKAAQIIREDIRAEAYELDKYPTAEESSLNADILPDTLTLLLETIVTTRSSNVHSVSTKQRALGQAVVAACRPKSFLSPILLGVGVYIHRHYGSRQLIDLLSSIGFSVPYNEILRYENCVIAHETHTTTHGNGEYVQFSFDNADFNVRTMTGHDTFHSMGGVMMSAPAPQIPEKSVPRHLHLTAAAVTAGHGHMDVTWYQKPPQPGLRKVVVKEVAVTSLETAAVLNRARALDALWLSGSWSGVENPASWSGYMKLAMSGEMVCERTQVDALPFINLSPSNPSTVYSALLFASKECERRGQALCSVTFDQPLFIKAAEIVAAENPRALSNVVVRLGGFHTIMAFMGAIGFVMSGSGLENLWEQVYAEASVVHMISGHAFSRALRAHFLTQKAVGTILLQHGAALDHATKEELKSLHSQFLCEKELTQEKVFKDPAVECLLESLDRKVQELSSLSRTARLWLQYFKHIELVRLFIRAERTGDWALHLDCVRKMLPLFHAAGRYHYAKAAHLYAQQMEELGEKMPVEEFAKFTSAGYFTIRRNHDFWSGTWSDQVIEQDLMRPLKSQGGLTHGRGINESSLAHYIYSFPGCLKLCNAMEELGRMTAKTSEQHVELRDSRRSMDCRDLQVFQGWLETHSPFLASDNLHSLANGIVADTRVNCDRAQEIGEEGVKEMLNKSFADVKVTRRYKVVPLSVMNGTVTVRDEVLPVNSSQLFMRIVCVLKNDTDKTEYFRFELAPTPPALFDGCCMRKTDKSALASLFTHTNSTEQLLADSKFVIDGGYLLHAATASWPRLATYGDICHMYVRHVTKHYSSAVVVFDGYSGQPSTKDEEQRRRAARRSCPDFDFTENTTSTTSQSDFLANKKNKARLIEMLAAKFEAAGVPVRLAVDDADALIVRTALDAELSGKSVVVVGNDTDLLVMLAARNRSEGKVIMLHPGTANSPAKVFDISLIQEQIGGMKDALLFTHAVTGGDKTCAIYVKGKKKAYSLLQKNECLRREVVDIFSCPTSDPKDVSRVGEKFIKALYPSGESFENIDELRFHLYSRSVARQAVTAHFELATLPPTRAAVQQHSFRTYLQVQEWLENYFNPADWDWCATGGTLIPVPTTLPPAPDTLLRLIACACKADCGARCGCRRSGQQCSEMCSLCHGQSCTNTTVFQDDSDEPDN